MVGKAAAKSIDEAAVRDEKQETSDSLQPGSNTAHPVDAGGSGQSVGKGSRVQRLPEDLEERIGGRVFENEDELAAALEEHLISDEPIVLGDDGRAYYYMRGDVNGAHYKQILRLVTRYERTCPRRILMSD